MGYDYQPPLPIPLPPYNEQDPGKLMKCIHLRDNLITINELIDKVWGLFCDIRQNSGFVDSVRYRLYRHYIEFIVYKINQCFTILLSEVEFKTFKSKHPIVEVVSNIFNAFKHSSIMFEMTPSIGEKFPTILAYYDPYNKYCYVSNDNMIYYNCSFSHIIAGFEDFLDKIYFNEDKNITQHKVHEHNVTLCREV